MDKQDLQRIGWGYSDDDYNRISDVLHIGFVQGHNVLEFRSKNEGIPYIKKPLYDELAAENQRLREAIFAESRKCCEGWCADGGPREWEDCYGCTLAKIALPKEVE